MALPNMVAQPSTKITEDWENELGLERTVYTKYLRGIGFSLSLASLLHTKTGKPLIWPADGGRLLRIYRTCHSSTTLLLPAMPNSSPIHIVPSFKQNSIAVAIQHQPLLSG